MSTATDTTYDGILHRKSQGSLVLSDRGLCFRNVGDTAAVAAGGHARLVLPWQQVTKHQVSPASHPKSLLKVLANTPPPPSATAAVASSFTFAFPGRPSLERARRDITARLSRVHAASHPRAGQKRPRDAGAAAPAAPLPPRRGSAPVPARYAALDPLALVATRAALLAADPALRAQHRLLVLDGVGTLSEGDFWQTHARLVADEHAKICGATDRGASSGIRSSLDLGLGGAKGGAGEGGGGGERAGVVHLGVEEMRQIFIMYPAVHRAYEEKVPLELSEEQFWRKYLESEYFHRDRGRMGAHIGKVNERELSEQERVFGGKRLDDDHREISKDEKKRKDKEAEKEKLGEEEAKNRLAAATTDDIFSRYATNKKQGRRPLGMQKIAVGQFDLAATHDAERGDRFLQLQDLHPPPDKDSAGARVIDKYNRHWAVVLHPTESTAGVDLHGVAARSAARAAEVGDAAEVHGGEDRALRQLIGFAAADARDADPARGVGDGAEGDELLELRLRDVAAYSGAFPEDRARDRGTDAELHLRYARYLAAGLRAGTAPLLRAATAGRSKGFDAAPRLARPLPDPRIGRGLMEAMTKKMAADSRTEADVQRLADALPEGFKTKLATFFRRSSELLRHFFSLRSVFNEDEDGHGGIGLSESQKNRLTNIVKGMEKVHGEMYELTRNLPLMESKMFKPIMDQLDWAFKLHREDSSKSKGGFVTVAKGGFVPVAH